jgi:hypothetical protein
VAEVAVPTDRGLQYRDDQRSDVGRRVELDHRQGRSVSAPHDHPGENRRGIRIGEDDDHDGSIHLDAVGHHDGHGLGPVGPVEVAEEVDRGVDGRPEVVGTVDEVGYGSNGHPGLGNTGVQRVVHHPAVPDDHDACDLTEGRQVTLDEGVRGALTLQRREPVKVEVADPGVSPDLFLRAGRINVVQADKGRPTDLG